MGGEQKAIMNGNNGNVPDNASQASSPVKNDPQQAQEISRLTLLVKQRDNEIGILLNYLNKKKTSGENGNASMVS